MYGVLFTNRVTFNLLKPLWYSRVERHRIFTLQSTRPRDKWDLERKAERAVCKSLIAILKGAAVDAFVYGITSSSPQFERYQHFLDPQRGKWAIDLSADCISGYEEFWLTSYEFKRGSILFRLRDDTRVINEVFGLLYNPLHIDNPATIHTRSAIQYAKRKVEEKDGEVYFVFPVSGVWQVEIIASSERIVQLFKSAGWKCRFALDAM